MINRRFITIMSIIGTIQNIHKNNQIILFHHQNHHRRRLCHFFCDVCVDLIFVALYLSSSLFLSVSSLGFFVFIFVINVFVVYVSIFVSSFSVFVFNFILLLSLTLSLFLSLSLSGFFVFVTVAQHRLFNSSSTQKRSLIFIIVNYKTTKPIKKKKTKSNSKYPSLPNLLVHSRPGYNSLHHSILHT